MVWALLPKDKTYRVFKKIPSPRPLLVGEGEGRKKNAKMVQ
jgi:hypothetical protein